jgi:THO complex subunit 5
MTLEQIVTEPALLSVLALSAKAREHALQVVQLLLQTVSTNGEADNGTTTVQQIEVAKQLKVVEANVARLRGLHRREQHTAREIKAQTAAARQEVDRLHLQLQNLYYEQRHLQGEIEACESYEYVRTVVRVLESTLF